MDSSNQKIYENFLEHCRQSSVFQTFQFGEFQKKIPYREKSWALVTKNEKGNVAATCLVIKIKMRFGQSWLWIPYGPLVDENTTAHEQNTALNEIFNDLAQIAKEEHAIFARIEPANTLGNRPGADFDQLDKKWRTQKSPSRFTPEHSLILDLTKSEEEILAQMKPKGRYNIQVAKKHGVTVEQCNLQSLNSCIKSVPGNTDATQNYTAVHQAASQGEKPDSSYSVTNKMHPVGASINSFVAPRFVPHCGTPLGAFYKILQNTGARDGFGIHPRFFYETLLKTFGSKNSTLFLAYAPNKKNVGYEAAKPIAGIIIVYYKDTATYYFGASDHKHRNLMAPYLLQWEAIREAKKRNMKFYDFLGIAPTGSAKEKDWVGVTEFKKKFGGNEISYPPAFDIIYKPLIYKTLQTVGKIKKNITTP